MRKIMQSIDGFTIIDAEQNQQIRSQLMRCIATQVNVLETAELFVMVFKWIILIHFISVAVIIGIGSINLLLVSIHYIFIVSPL